MSTAKAPAAPSGRICEKMNKPNSNITWIISFLSIEIDFKNFMGIEIS